MLLSLDWLQEYVDVDIGAEELADKMSLTGTEVESIQRIGTPGQEDVVLHLEITPNRPDCMGVIGMARETGAFLQKKIKKPMVRSREINVPVSQSVKVKVADRELCPRYAARVLRNIKVSESPDWMKKRLEAIGVRSVNNVVDITNYVMLESGQPLHAFDMDRLVGDAIEVRRAAPEEKIIAIDGIERALNSEMLVIADGQGPVAIAGVMGGANSEVSGETKTILLESANFDPTSVLKTSRQLGLISESSLRFERGVDIGGTLWALDRAAELVRELASGEVLKGHIDVFQEPPKQRQILLRSARVNKILGTELTGEEIGDVLGRLGLGVSLQSPAQASNPELMIQIPSFRVDLEREIDVIEEVARLYGYDRIEATLPASRQRQGLLTRRQKSEGMIKELLIAAGLWETINFSFLDDSELDSLGYAKDSPEKRLVELRNPITSEQSKMRSSLIPGLIRTINVNVARSLSELRIFEMGRVFHPERGRTLPIERLVAAGALTGRTERGLGRQEESWDFFDAKGVVEFLLGRLGIESASFERSQGLPYHEGRCARVVIGEKILGRVGELHPEVQSKMELPNRVALFELDIDALIEALPPTGSFAELSRYPTVSVDLAVVVDEDVASGKVEEVIRGQAGDLLERLVIFDLYTGAPVPKGRKSLAYSLTFRAPDRTLDWAEVETVRDEIVRELESKLQAGLRI